MVRNATVETENNTRKIKAAVQTVGGSRHPRKVLGILVVNPSIKMTGLGVIFQEEENKYILEEALEEYAVTTDSVAYGDPQE